MPRSGAYSIMSLCLCTRCVGIFVLDHNLFLSIPARHTYTAMARRP